MTVTLYFLRVKSCIGISNILCPLQFFEINLIFCAHRQHLKGNPLAQMKVCTPLGIQHKKCLDL